MLWCDTDFGRPLCRTLPTQQPPWLVSLPCHSDEVREAHTRQARTAALKWGCAQPDSRLQQRLLRCGLSLDSLSSVPRLALSACSGFYYYLVSLLAAFYLVFVHTASRQTRRIIKATISLLNPASYRRKPDTALLSPTSSKAAAAAEAQAARLIHARADAALGMSLYKHHRDLLPTSIVADGGARAGQLAGGKDDPSTAAPWSIARCPVVHRSFRTRDGTLISYHVLYPGNPRTMVFANGLGAASDFSAFASVIHRCQFRAGSLLCALPCATCVVTPNTASPRLCCLTRPRSCVCGL